jgi:hypothetical protein
MTKRLGLFFAITVLLSALSLSAQTVVVGITGGSGGGGGTQEVQKTAFTLSEADLLALDSTPINVIPAPGAGKLLVPVAVSFLFPATGTAYYGGDFVFDIVGADDASFHLNTAGLLSQPGRTFWQGARDGVSDDSDCTNQPLRLRTFGSWNSGPITAAEIVDGGVDYHVGDLVSTNTDITRPVIRVSAVNGMGSVTALVVDSAGIVTAGAGVGANPYGNVSSSVVNAGGAAFAPGDTFRIDGSGDVAAEGEVDTVDGGGAVTMFHLTNLGTLYMSGTGVTTTPLSGGGSGLTLDIIANTGSGLTFNLTVAHGTGPVKGVVYYSVANFN